jgi:hypothetical protein
MKRMLFAAAALAALSTGANARDDRLSRERLELANEAGSLDLALDVARGSDGGGWSENEQ